jgi:gas vesicle protein
MSDERGALGTNLLLFLLGAAAGAVLVALTTPKTGTDLRADIKDLAAKLKRKAGEAGMGLCPVCGQEGEHEHEHEGETGG